MFSFDKSSLYEIIVFHSKNFDWYDYLKNKNFSFATKNDIVILFLILFFQWQNLLYMQVTLSLQRC